jgi:predicted membrane channel-forming protein YqfA (hemolysin III family)
MDQSSLIVWGCLTIIAIFTVLLVRRRLNKSLKLELSEFISLALAILGVMSSCQLIYKPLTLKVLQDLLGADIVTLTIGAIAVIWVSAKEVWKITVGL